ncbi:MAG: hypothetical protein HPY55_04235 [Firmicutes bacterium]|nr:hypothetical protein [Bacillota bacterium]
MSGQVKRMPYAEVWGDTVDLVHLASSTVIGIVLTLGGYLVGLQVFSAQKGLSEALVKGYALMVGVTGCVASGVIAATLYRPKRVLVEKAEQVDVAEALATLGMRPEEEAAAVESVEAAARDELRELGLFETLSKAGGKGGTQ